MALNFGAVLKIIASDKGGEGVRVVDTAKSADDSAGVVNWVGAVTNESSEIAGELEGSTSVKYGVAARGISTVWAIDSLFAGGGYGGFLRDGSEEGIPWAVVTRSDGMGIGEDTLMPVCIGDSCFGLLEVLAIGAGSEDLRAWVCGSRKAVLDG